MKNARLFNPKGTKKVMNPDIPNTCGVYIFLHKGKIVYVGKSTELRRRIASHYSKSAFTQLMINPDIEYQVAIIETKNDEESLILSSSGVLKFIGYIDYSLTILFGYFIILKYMESDFYKSLKYPDFMQNKDKSHTEESN